MNERAAATPPLHPESYSPRRRTALVLSGTGTAGAYHAGVLRALHEAGVKLDIVGGRGIGVVGALFTAIAGESRLWEPKGFWTSPAVASLYAWRRVPRLFAWGLAASLVVVAIPIATLAGGLIVFPIDFVLKMAGLGGASGVTGAYMRLVSGAFAPTALPTWLPRIVVLILSACALVAAVSGWAAGRRRRQQGPFWWRMVRPPLSIDEAAAHVWRALWEVIGGAAQIRQPASSDLGRRYAELLADNIGQPGFRELIVTVHDVDARRDLVFALVSESRRASLVRRATSAQAAQRRAEVFDLIGAPGDQLAAMVSASLTVPLATETQNITFGSDSFWRGETHRLCDRPGSLARLLDELVDLEVEQIVLVSASAESQGPHELPAPRLDGRGRIGEYLSSAEAAAVRDVTCAAGVAAPQIFKIAPGHNPVGPFDFEGAYDDRSERRHALAELMARGYEDAYRQFIEPVVGASGDRMGRVVEGV
jgi:hypothetical protein